MVRVRVTDNTDNRGTYKQNVSNIIQYEEPWCITWNHMVCIIRPLGLQNIKGLQRAQKKAEWMTLPKNQFLQMRYIVLIEPRKRPMLTQHL